MTPPATAATALTARRVAPGVPVWTVLADGRGIGSVTNLPMERAWCLTAYYCGRRLDYRAASPEAVLLALRCAVDAIDHADHAASVEEAAEDYIEDEDGERAAMRAAEARADAWASRWDMQEPIF